MWYRVAIGRTERRSDGESNGRRSPGHIGTFQRGKLMWNVILHGAFGVILDWPAGQNRETGES